MREKAGDRRGAGSVRVQCLIFASFKSKRHFVSYVSVPVKSCKREILKAP